MHSWTILTPLIAHPCSVEPVPAQAWMKEVRTFIAINRRETVQSYRRQLL